MRRIHQLLTAFSPRDAISQAAVELQWLLRRSGIVGSIYANDVARGFDGLARPTSQLSPQLDDVVLYHHGNASELAGRFLHYRCHRGLICHDLAPSRSETRASVATTLTEGHAQLVAMARHVDVSIASSKFHAEALTAAGHRNVHTVPWFVEPSRFGADSADAALFKKLKKPGPLLVLALGPLGTQQRLEDVLSLHREIQRTHRNVRTLILDDSKEQRLALRLFKIPSQVSFLRNPTHAERVAAYRAADVFVSMSEHEGFSIRLLDAMAADVPVLAFACAGVPETLGGYGIGFDEKHYGGLSELVLRLRDDVPLRERIIEGQRKRVAQLSPENTRRELMSALESIPAATRSLSSKTSKRRRIAVVVQRYGANITGGAESHARQIAQRLASHAEVTVLTTTAQNHLTWADAFAEGAEKDDRVRVMRFSCGGQRAMRAFNWLSRQTFKEKQSRIFEERWIAEQGPKAPALLEHIADHAQYYDAFIFFTYLYAPTVWGLPLVAQRALLVPTAHDEPPFQFGAYADAFELPRALLCNTLEESRLIENRFPKVARRRVVGVGIDVPSDFQQRWRPVKEPYLLYLGRREAGKGLPELVSHQRWLTQTQSNAPTLVFAGDGDWKVNARNTHVQGRVSEAEKFDAIREALAVVVPSRLESLSLVMLEAFACGTPVIGNAASEVIQGHLTRSQAGFSYSDRESYADAVSKVQSERKELTHKAFLYSRQFRWEKVIEAYHEELERISR